jgi:hypothetical protein
MDCWIRLVVRPNHTIFGYHSEFICLRVVADNVPVLPCTFKHARCTVTGQKSVSSSLVVSRICRTEVSAVTLKVIIELGLASESRACSLWDLAMA